MLVLQHYPPPGKESWNEHIRVGVGTFTAVNLTDNMKVRLNPNTETLVPLIRTLKQKSIALLRWYPYASNNRGTFRLDIATDSTGPTSRQQNQSTSTFITTGKHGTIQAKNPFQLDVVGENLRLVKTTSSCTTTTTFSVNVTLQPSSSHSASGQVLNTD